jgi:hypothetical protein
VSVDGDQSNRYEVTNFDQITENCFCCLRDLSLLHVPRRSRPDLLPANVALFGELLESFVC